MADIPINLPSLGQAECDAVMSVLESGMLAEGEAVHRFESEFANYCETDHAVATANGTAALHAALEAVGIRPGSTVVTTPFSFVASANAIRLAGGIPVFADIDPETYTLDPTAVEQRIRELEAEFNEGIDAILAVHLYGLAADVGRLREIADDYDAALVEDAAQAHGATFDGQPVGSFGDAAAFSFYPTKNMTTGEGGMVTTNRSDVAVATRRFVDHGRDPDGESYAHRELGHNYRMTNIGGAIGREQLERLPGFVETRRKNARMLDEKLADAPVEPPVVPTNRRHAFNLYTVRCSDRTAVSRALEAEGVGSRVYYPTPIHKLEAYDGFSVSCPIAEEAASEVLSLPVHPGVDTDAIDRIAETVRRETLHA